MKNESTIAHFAVELTKVLDLKAASKTALKSFREGSECEQRDDSGYHCIRQAMRQDYWCKTCQEAHQLWVKYQGYATKSGVLLRKLKQACRTTINPD